MKPTVQLFVLLVLIAVSLAPRRGDAQEAATTLHRVPSLPASCTKASDAPEADVVVFKSTVYVCGPGGWTPASGASASGDGIQYVTSHGNDSNDGLTWLTSKLTPGAACAALPGGNASCTTGVGTIYAAPGYSVYLPAGTTPSITLEIIAAPSGTAGSSTAPVGGTMTSGPIPWIDARAFGARAFQDNTHTLTVTTNSTNSAKTAGLADFVAGDGIAIPRAGNMTSQSTPSAPVVTNVGANGSSTISYKCVGIDQNWGLTAASAAGSTTTAPTVFGQAATAIATISRRVNVVTVTTRSALPFSSGEYHATIGAVTGGTTKFAGLFLVTVTSGTTLTYNQAGANESGTITANQSYVLFENAFVLTRVQATAGSNRVVLTTDVNHNLQNQMGTTHPTKLFLDGIYFAGAPNKGYASGLFSIASTTANTITVITPYVATETATATANVNAATSGVAQMTATVWAEQLVTCPTLAGTTMQYAVYGNYGSGYAPIGFTTWLHNIFIDYGPAFTKAGFIPPPGMNLPPVPPASAQNQIFSAQIKFISGSTLTLDRPVPTSVSSVTAYHDNGIPLLNAINESCQASGGFYPSMNGKTTYPVYLAPTPSAQYYFFNAPVDLSTNTNVCGVNVVDGGALWLNGTITSSARAVSWRRPEDIAGINVEANGGNTRFDVYVFGYASPLFGGNIHSSTWWVSGLLLAPLSNGQNGFVNTGADSRFEDVGCMLASGALQSTTCFVNAGSQFTTYFHNFNWGGYPNLSAPLTEGPPLDGQVTYWPVPSFLEEAGPSTMADILMDGQNYGIGEGFEISYLYPTTGVPLFEKFENVQTYQGPYSPFLTITGNAQIKTVVLDDIQMDSQAMPAISCLIGGPSGGNCAGLLTLRQTETFAPGASPVMTGLPFKAVFEQIENGGIAPAQNVNEAAIGPNGLQQFGSQSLYCDPTTGNTTAALTVYDNKNNAHAVVTCPTGAVASSSGGGTTNTICSRVAVTMPTTTILSGATSVTATAACAGLTKADSITCSSNVALFSGSVVGFTASTGGILMINVWPTANTINAQYENDTDHPIKPSAVTLNCGSFH